jgi:hypothetical protein
MRLKVELELDLELKLKLKLAQEPEPKPEPRPMFTFKVITEDKETKTELDMPHAEDKRVDDPVLTVLVRTVTITRPCPVHHRIRTCLMFVTLTGVTRLTRVFSLRFSHIGVTTLRCITMASTLTVMT